MRQRLHQFITAIAAYALKQIGQQGPTGPAAPIMALKYRRHPRPSVFGTTPPVPDPGGVHAYMMRHR